MTSSYPTTKTTAFAAAIERFLRTQEGRNRSAQTLRAYRSDLTQLATWLRTDNAASGGQPPCAQETHLCRALLRPNPSVFPESVHSSPVVGVQRTGCRRCFGEAVPPAGRAR